MFPRRTVPLRAMPLSRPGSAGHPLLVAADLLQADCASAGSPVRIGLVTVWRACASPADAVLGRPFWRRDDGTGAAARSVARAELVEARRPGRGLV